MIGHVAGKKLSNSNSDTRHPLAFYMEQKIPSKFLFKNF